MMSEMIIGFGRKSKLVIIVCVLDTYYEEASKRIMWLQVWKGVGGSFEILKFRLESNILCGEFIPTSYPMPIRLSARLEC